MIHHAIVGLNTRQPRNNRSNPSVILSGPACMQCTCTYSMPVLASMCSDVLRFLVCVRHVPLHKCHARRRLQVPACRALFTVLMQVFHRALKTEPWLLSLSGSHSGKSSLGKKATSDCLSVARKALGTSLTPISRCRA